MNWKRGLGIGLIFIGLFIVLTGKVITGNAVGLGSENYLGLFGLLIFIIGVFFMIVSGLEGKVKGAEFKLEHEEAHSATGYERLRKSYKLTESLGTSPEDSKAWVTVYHAFMRGKTPNLKEGFDKEKSSEGFYFTMNQEEAYNALEAKGVNPSDINIFPLKIARNVFKNIVKEAPSTEGDYFYIPAKKFKQANELIDKGYIRMDA